MALKDSRGGREYDKFVADSSGDTAMRVSSTSHATSEATSTGGIDSPITVTETVSTNVGTTILAATTVEGKERIGLQFFNVNGATNVTFKVWGSLVDEPGVPLKPAASSVWSQIGDDIEVITTAFNTYKAISTTPMKSVAVTAVKDGGGATTAAVHLLAD